MALRRLDRASACDPPPAGQNWPADCDAFDRNFDFFIDDAPPGADGGGPTPFEVIHAITPFGGPEHLEVDLTDLANGLPGKHGLRVDDIDVWELNEAFASQVVYCRDRLGLSMDKLNLNGGSISIGHPFGMTGSRLVGTIANEMARRKARYGVVTMCVGGGQGAAALFERA